MTDSKNTVSDERLAHYIEYADLVGDNGTPAISTGELASMARELQPLRASIPGGVGVTDADLRSFAETVDLIAEGDFYKDYDRAIAAIDPMRRILSALFLSLAEEEIGR